ncbi:AMP-dependent synthetase [Alicycliphilus sp. B1]|nr:AMP-dependent synthetase [Alicycliphilus sp. B1]
MDFADRPLGRDLLYSSGTTGRPKGVLKALWPAELRGQADPEAVSTARLLGMGEDTVYLSPAPLYHAAPLRYTLRALELGGRAVIMERFDAENALALIERYASPTASGCPPCSAPAQAARASAPAPRPVEPPHGHPRRRALPGGCQTRHARLVG